VAALSAAIRNLDVSLADHWPHFQVLTPHVLELLAGAARHLGRRQRRDLMDCMVSCITSYLWSRAEPRAEQLAAHALELGRDLGCADSPEHLRLRHVHAWAIRDQGRFAEAAESLRHVLEAQRALPGGATHVDTLRTRHDLAWALGRLGRWSDAETELRQVLRESRAHRQGPEQDRDDAFILHTRCKLCWCVGKQGRWNTAEHDYRQLLTDRMTILGRNHPDTLDTRESLGKTLSWQGKWADAETEFHILAADRGRTLGERHPDTLLARQLETYAAGHLARLHHDRRGLRAATAQLEQIRRDQESEHRNTKDTHAFLATLCGTYSPDMPWTDDLPRPETE
jgi:tetratricopeptide (TPR) repeat protein